MARATTGLSYLTFGVVILGSIVFSVFVIYPKFGEYQDEKTKLSQVLNVEKENTAFLENLDLRKQDLEKYATDVKALHVALPEKFVQSSLWVNINDIATKSGVSLAEIGQSKKDSGNKDTAQAEKAVVSANNIFAGDGTSVNKSGVPTVEEAAAKKKLDRWETSLSFSGTYSQVRTFVKNLENSLILSDIKEFSMKPVSGDKEVVSDSVEVSMVIRTYVQP